jgi:uncharacterized protein
MKYLSCLIVALAIGAILISFRPTRSQSTLLEEITKKDMPYDESWATAMQADELGMKRYVMAFLKRGPKRDHTAEEAAKLQQAHMENIGRMAKEGHLIVAGPFLDSGDVRGIYVFNVDSIEKAKELTATDPAIQAGRLEMELHPWYGSAALQLTVPLHSRLAKKNP